MKTFKLDLLKKEYSLDINDCIDFKIAGALSIFESEYFKYYCAFWTIYKNWMNIDEAQLRSKICSIFGFDIISDSINSSNIIMKIKESIDNGHPVLLFVCSSSLFFSVMYMNDVSNYLGHVLLITGYDDDKELIYIKENSINKEIMNFLTNSNPLFQYQLKYEMIIDIINKNICLIPNYENISFYNVVQKEDIDLHYIKDIFFRELKNLIKNENDNLVNEIIKIMKNNFYSNKTFDQQFHRNYINSLEALMDVLEDNKSLLCDDEYTNYKNLFMQNRKKVVSTLCKNAYKNCSVDFDELNKLIDIIKANNNKFFNFIKNHNLLTDSINKENLYNLLLLKNTDIFVDSEKIIKNGVVFSAKSFLKKNILDSGNDFWASNDSDLNHWLKIVFPCNYIVNKIIIEHSKYKDSITSDFQILFSNNNIDWEESVSIIDNQNAINTFEFSNKVTKYILINITKPNRLLNKMAIIRKLYVLGNKEGSK